MSGVEIVKLDPEQVIEYWPICSGRVGQAVALDNGASNVNDMLSAVLAGHLDLLVVRLGEKAVGEYIVGIVTYPRKRRLRVYTVSGRDAKSWLAPSLFILRNAAKADGLDGIEAFVRPGMRRVLQRYGYEPSMEVVICDG